MNTTAKNILFYIFFFGIIYFFGKTVYNNFGEIKNYNFRINFGYLFLSLVSFLLFFYSLGILWKNLLFSSKSNSLHGWSSPNLSGRRGIAQKNSPLSLGEGLGVRIHYINAISWVSKYIPGKVAMIATKVLYLEKFGYSKKLSFLSCLYEHIFQIISSFLISLPFIIYYFWGGENNLYIYLSSISIIIGLVFIQPNIFNKILNIILKLFKKHEYQKQDFLNWKNISKYIIGYSLSMILKGISFAFLVASIISINNFNEVIFYIFAWIFAGVIGILAIFTPNGLGVREGVLTLILSLVLPLEIAILLSVISRVWFSLCDGVIALYIGYVRYLGK